jgi:hypothetical protein
MLTTIIQWLTIYILIITIIYSVFPIKEDLTDFEDTEMISKLTKQNIHKRNGLSTALCEDSIFKTPLFASSCPKIRARGNTIHNDWPDIGTYDCVTASGSKPIYKKGTETKSSASLKQCAEEAKDTKYRGFRYNDKNKECKLITGTIDKYKGMNKKYYVDISKNMKWTSSKSAEKLGAKAACFSTTANSNKMTRPELLCLNQKCHEACETECGKGKCNDAKMFPTVINNAAETRKASNYTCNIRCKPAQNPIINKSTNHCPKDNRVYIDDITNWSKTGYIYYPKHDQCFDSGNAKNFKQCIEPCYKLSDDEIDTCRRINIDIDSKTPGN